jgi:hypothetical protein
MEVTGRFSASNWSKTNPPCLSDCRLVMLYKGVKYLWAEFLPAEFGTFLLVAQQPEELWTNRDHSRIQRIK